MHPVTEHYIEVKKIEVSLDNPKSFFHRRHVTTERRMCWSIAFDRAPVRDRVTKSKRYFLIRWLIDCLWFVLIIIQSFIHSKDAIARLASLMPQHSIGTHHALVDLGYLRIQEFMLISNFVIFGRKGFARQTSEVDAADLELNGFV